MQELYGLIWLVAAIAFVYKYPTVAFVVFAIVFVFMVLSKRSQQR